VNLIAFVEVFLSDAVRCFSWFYLSY